MWPEWSNRIASPRAFPCPCTRVRISLPKANEFRDPRAHQSCLNEPPDSSAAPGLPSQRVRESRVLFATLQRDCHQYPLEILQAAATNRKPAANAINEGCTGNRGLELLRVHIALWLLDRSTHPGDRSLRRHV